MSTINYQYVLDRLGEKNLKALMPDGDNGINQDLIDAFIIDADAIIDAELAKKYKFPYEQTDEVLGVKAYSIIKIWKLNIVRKLIYQKTYDNEEMKEVNTNYYTMLSSIKKISQGDEELLGLVRLESGSADLIKSSTTTQVFTKEIMSRLR